MIGNKKQIIEYLIDEGKDKLWEVKEHKEKRSLNANAYFHVLCQKIAEKTSQSLSEAKNQLMADYGQIDAEMGCVIMWDEIEWKKLQTLHLLPTSATRTMDDGKLYRVYRVIRGSHTYDTKEMSRLIDGTVEEAKELGIETLPPDELRRMMERWSQ